MIIRQLTNVNQTAAAPRAWTFIRSCRPAAWLLVAIVGCMSAVAQRTDAPRPIEAELFERLDESTLELENRVQALPDSVGEPDPRRQESLERLQASKQQTQELKKQSLAEPQKRELRQQLKEAQQAHYNLSAGVLEKEVEDLDQERAEVKAAIDAARQVHQLSKELRRRVNPSAEDEEAQRRLREASMKRIAAVLSLAEKLEADNDPRFEDVAADFNRLMAQHDLATDRQLNTDPLEDLLEKSALLEEGLIGRLEDIYAEANALRNTLMEMQIDMAESKFPRLRAINAFAMRQGLTELHDRNMKRVRAVREAIMLNDDDEPAASPGDTAAAQEYKQNTRRKFEENRRRFHNLSD